MEKLSIFALLLLTPPAMLACTCGPPEGTVREVAEHYAASADLVFEGQVLAISQLRGDAPIGSRILSITPTGTHLSVTLRTLRTYHGEARPTNVVVTASSEAACGVDFDIGLSYLVYAYSRRGQSHTGLCTGTELLQHSAPHLRFLRGQPALPEDHLPFRDYYRTMAPRWTGVVCGNVQLDDGSSPEGALLELWRRRLWTNQPVKHALGLTDERGDFCTDPVLPGKYLLTATLGEFWKTNTQYVGYFPGVLQRKQATALEVTAGKTTGNIVFRLAKRRLFAMDGHLRTADGAQLPRSGFRAALEQPDGELLTDHVARWVQEDGTFWFGHLLPGRYAVTLHAVPIRDSAGRLSFPARGWAPTMVEFAITDHDIVLPVTMRRANDSLFDIWLANYTDLQFRWDHIRPSQPFRESRHVLTALGYAFLFYLALPASFIAGWVRWARQKTRPTILAMASFTAFAIATVSALLALVLSGYAYNIGGFPFLDPTLSSAYRVGFLLSVTGLVSAFAGAWRSHPLRWYAPACAAAMALFWSLAALSDLIMNF